ncbi:MAG: protein translocase subunit SecY [Candidatus Hepatoplasma vulgare]|nr:MAG: protein translocase subunit SecY [Candidatus Hepatoplasma sp.]
MIKEMFTNWKILKKILYTLGFLLLFRFGTLLTIPGASVEDSYNFDQGSFLGILNILGGGGLATFSIFALGVTPYITASIIIQLLSSDVIPPLSRLNKQGEKGRMKVEKITRILAIFLAFIQAFSITLALTSTGYVFYDGGTAEVVYFVFIMVVGSMISIWIADQITMKGIGNGTSLIIVFGLLASIPYKLIGAWDVFVGSIDSNVFIGFVYFAIYIMIALITIFILGFFETSERRLPIQQTGQGLNLNQEKQTYLPMKVNPAGVIPVIFASAIITLPPTIAQFFPDSAGKVWVENHFALTSWMGITIYALLIIGFTFFYSQININPEETAENFQKTSTYIVGVKPGEETRKYIAKTVNAMSLFGSFVLMIIAILPYLLTHIGIPQSVAMGGTGMIIMVSVSIDTWDQLKSRVIAERTKQRSGVNRKANVKKFGEVKDIKKEKKDNDTLLFD